MEVTAEVLRSLMTYDPTAGVFWWRSNPARSTQWNARYAGQIAGAFDIKGYQIITICRKAYKAHRLAYLYIHGAWPTGDVDHINGDKADNRIANLREATRSQNCANKGVGASNTSGVKGVSWNRSLCKWGASIKANRRNIHLGYFNDLGEAQSVYTEAASEYFGQFARAQNK